MTAMNERTNLDDDLDDEEPYAGLKAIGLPVRTAPAAPTLRQMSTPVQALVAESWAPATRHAYEQSWARFAAWCHATRRLDPLDAQPADLADYVAYHVQAGLTPAYLARNLAAINAVYDMAELSSPARHPLVRRAVAGAKRVRGTAARQAAPISLDEMRRIVTGMAIITGRQPNSLTIRRDRALLLLGWYGALRAGELVGLDVDDLTFTGDPDRGDTGGLLIRLRTAKTDTEHADQWVAIPWSQRIGSCPARATMLLARTQRTGPLFRSLDRHGRQHGRLSVDAVTDIVRRHLTPIGVNTDLYSSHSLRAGWVTEARYRGLAPHLIMRHTRHTDARMLTVYDRPADLLHDNQLGEW